MIKETFSSEMWHPEEEDIAKEWKQFRDSVTKKKKIESST